MPESTSPAALAALLASRRSTPSRLLRAPGPDHDTLLRMLQLAVHVPDHGKLEPWRFLLVEGGARARLGELLAGRHAKADAAVAEAALEKDRQRFLHAPTIVVVVGRIDPDHRIPAQEQLLSGACACFSLLLAAHAHGFGAQWLTGWAAYDAEVCAGLGLGVNERILGFVHIGSTDALPPERPRADPAQLLERWNG